MCAVEATLAWHATLTHTPTRVFLRVFRSTPVSIPVCMCARAVPHQGYCIEDEQCMFAGMSCGNTSNIVASSKGFTPYGDVWSPEPAFYKVRRPPPPLSLPPGFFARHRTSIHSHARA